MKRKKQTTNRKYLKHGTYSLGAVAVFVGIILVLNLLMQELPSKYREIDLSSEKLYSIGEESKKLLKDLDEDVTLYLIAQNGTESSDLTKLLEKYEEGSKHVKVEQVDPALNPKFTSQYTTDLVNNNSILVVSEDKNKLVDYQDLYETSVNYQTYTTDVTGFDGEARLTGAIHYVTSDNMPIMYALEGHGEQTMPGSVKDMIQKANIQIEPLNLLTTGAVPEDADCLFILSPQKDFTEEEAAQILAYLENGGKAMIISDYTGTEMTNFKKILTNYGVEPVEGLILEGSADHYVFQNPSTLLPVINSNEITSDLLDQNLNVLMPMTQGIGRTEEKRDSLGIESLLSTTDHAYSKVNVENMKTMEKESGDIDGPFDLGVSITETIDEKRETQIVYFASSGIFDDNMNALTAGANFNLITSSINWMCENEEGNTLVIPAKSLDVTPLMIPAADVGFWSIFVTVFLPGALLILGTCIWLKRRKK